MADMAPPPPVPPLPMQAPSPNPLNSSLFQGNAVGPMGLNPAASQAGANQQMTAQQQEQAQNLANLLRKEGQTPAGSGDKKPFTSPWQVAGQWAQALQARNKQNLLNPQYQQNAAATAPGAPGQGPATPNAAAPPTPNPLQWSGSPQGAAAMPAGAPVPPQASPPQGQPPPYFYYGNPQDIDNDVPGWTPTA